MNENNSLFIELDGQSNRYINSPSTKDIVKNIIDLSKSIAEKTRLTPNSLVLSPIGIKLYVEACGGEVIWD